MSKITFRKYVIYRIYNTCNNKSYIGKCQSGTARIFDHFKHYSNIKFEYRAKLLYRAMNKYGLDAFNWEILAEAPDNKVLSDFRKTNNEYLCVETGEIFKSKKDLCKRYNLDYSNFNLNTKKRQKLGLTFKLLKHRIKKESPSNANR